MCLIIGFNATQLLRMPDPGSATDTLSVMLLGGRVGGGLGYVLQ